MEAHLATTIFMVLSKRGGCLGWRRQQAQTYIRLRDVAGSIGSGSHVALLGAQQARWAPPALVLFGAFKAGGYCYSRLCPSTILILRSVIDATMIATLQRSCGSISGCPPPNVEELKGSSDEHK